MTERSRGRTILRAIAMFVAAVFIIVVLALIGLTLLLRDLSTDPSPFTDRACPASSDELIVAAAAGDLSRVTQVIADGANASVVDSAGNSPLACAGAAGHLDVVEVLLEAGASPRIPARDGDTLVFDAVQHCRPEVLAALLDAGADPDATGRYEVPPLRLAADRGDLAMVQQLLDGGADPSKIDGAGIGFAEHSDACTAQTADIVPSAGLAVALSARAVLDADGDAGWVLGVAVRIGDAPLASAALAAGAGADHEYPAEGGSLAASICVAGGLEVLGAVECSTVDVLQMLVIDVDAGDAPGAVPVLVEAASRGQLDVVRLLLDAGADPDAATVEGLRAIHAATAFEHDDVVALLIARGADPNPRDPVTPAELRKLVLDLRARTPTISPTTTGAALVP